MEENVEFREAVLAAGFNSNSYEGIAEAIGCSVPYVRQIHQGSKPFSTAMRNKLTELAYGDNGQVDDVDEIKQIPVARITRQQNDRGAGFSVIQKSDGTFEIGEMTFTPVATAKTKGVADTICVALNNS